MDKNNDLTNNNDMILEIKMYNEKKEITKKILTREIEKEIEDLVKDLENWFNEEI
ncbi:MAG: hypothetical protein KatS3mg129_0237 [Leptospiraceae bacterium]|nr:MAG: hypothetical protein KatS3mg129_0237 [Leptospiraceae bacterium]